MNLYDSCLQHLLFRPATDVIKRRDTAAKEGHSSQTEGVSRRTLLGSGRWRRRLFISVGFSCFQATQTGVRTYSPLFLQIHRKHAYHRFKANLWLRYLNPIQYFFVAKQLRKFCLFLLHPLPFFLSLSGWRGRRYIKKIFLRGRNFRRPSHIFWKRKKGVALSATPLLGSQTFPNRKGS